MISRYTVMKPSNVQDSLTQEVYPDPLSVDYKDFPYSSNPIQIPLDISFMNRFYILTYKLYGVTYYDDIILDLNNIPHFSKLTEYNIIYTPVLTDMQRFISNAV